MNTRRMISFGLAMIAAVVVLEFKGEGASAPDIASLSKPQAGAMQMIFHGGAGPFQIQKRLSLEPNATWYDIPEAKVTEIETGVFLAVFPLVATEDVAYYRVVSAGETVVELKGWSIQVKVSPPANGRFFVRGERPVVTVTLLDNYAQGLSRADFSRLNLYLYGPEDPKKTTTAVKLLNTSTNRAQTVHHYIDLKTNPDVQEQNNIFTYSLQAVSDEAPGTYQLGIWGVRSSDAIQQVMRSIELQIGNATVETAVVSKTKCAACHEGSLSGKMYLHHIDPSSTPGSVGSWALDSDPVRSCKMCHNNEGYAAYRDYSVAGVTNRVNDPVVRRVHGVHMGEHLSNYANTNKVNGDFRSYTHVLFPPDVRNCTVCHVDDRWKTQPSRLACGSCHDNTWFGPETQVPQGMAVHKGGSATSDANCAVCHGPEGEIDPQEDLYPIVQTHIAPVPKMDAIDIAMTPPANGAYYVAGEKPVVTLVFKDSSGSSAIDHTKVTDANFSTASLFVYGPRTRTVPVLTSAARNVNSKLRASVSSSLPGPWAIRSNLFRIAINGSVPQDIQILGAANAVTATEVVSSLNSVITNLGARASVSGANVNIRTLIQGADARIEIYNGPVTATMGWKRGPNTVMEPDVTIAAGSLPGNDLRALSDPLDYSDPMVTRSVANITYQLDDVAALAPGTYGVYAYHLPRAGRITGLTNATGLGQMNFQVGTRTPEKKIATSCADCHGETIFHFFEGPIHAARFDPDYCKACHDYGHTAPGEMFKNQGGTSLSGWSGFGAMPIVRRVHGVHRGNYLQRPEEIYANATVDTFGHIIFPQDIRNCTKCHSESDTWKEKPSRIACLACHDSDAAKVHGQLMTFTPDAGDPYGPRSVETCQVCHGAGSAFSADKVHAITNPYVPPYQRAPRGE